MIRPWTNGPRSLMRTQTERPLLRLTTCTRVRAAGSGAAAVSGRRLVGLTTRRQATCQAVGVDRRHALLEIGVGGAASGFWGIGAACAAGDQRQRKRKRKKRSGFAAS